MAVSRRVETSDIVVRFRIYQVVLCIFWFIFSLTTAGCFDGWTRIRGLNEEGTGTAKFCIFLTVVESLGFTAILCIGVYAIFGITSVYCLYLNR